MADLQNTQEQFINGRILQDMSEGVLIIGLNGRITTANESAQKILEQDSSALLGRPFAACFMENAQNDEFTQLILDAVYDAGNAQRGIAPYYTGNSTKQLFITASYLKEKGKRIAVIVLLADITELAELRDALKAMQKIQQLNKQLESRNRLISATFGRYLSDEIVTQLLDTENGLELGGKKETLTVLMSDLRGFTALSERMDACHLIRMLNHYLAVMTEQITKYHGTIIEFLGDGILAVFGAPVHYEEHAALAAAAALAMQRSMSDINAWNAANGYSPLEMGIGVNTGEVIVGNIGSEKRTKYGVAGSNVNLCGRIESYTVGGQVLISENTLRCLNCQYVTDSCIEVFPKGVDTPIHTYSLIEMASPYNEKISRETMSPLPVPVPARIEFRRIDGKHICDDVHECRITAVSRDGAVIETPEPLEVFENIELEAYGKLTAKVISSIGDSYTLRFTSRQDVFDRWLCEMQSGTFPV